jgi:hypothetical protein
MDILQYGLQLSRSFLSPGGDISGYLCHSLIDKRMIIAFRGTVGGSNMVTDLNMLQIKLPNMKKSKENLDALFDIALEEFAQLTNSPLSPESISSHSPSQEFGGSPAAEPHLPPPPPPLGTHMSPEQGGVPSCLEQAKYCCECCFGWLPMSAPLIHLGFWQAYVSIRDEFWKSFILTLLKLLSSSQLSTEIYICGHSLGGALAVLAALDISMNLHLVLHKLSMLSPSSCAFLPQIHPFLANLPSSSFTLIVYTFGAPRIGNIAFCQRVESILPNLFRVEVDGDIICRMPSFFGLYRHCGVHIIIDSEEKGNLIVNPTVVETQLLRRSSGTTAHHTLSKYRECLEACFLPQELDHYLAKYYQLASRFHEKGKERSQVLLPPRPSGHSSRDFPIWL